MHTFGAPSFAFLAVLCLPPAPWSSATSVVTCDACDETRFAGMLTDFAMSSERSVDDATSPHGARSSQNQDAFARGRALLDQDQITDALDLWITLRDSLTTAGNPDPRIGTTFIATVAEHKLDLYEEVAALMFYWGFSVVNPDEVAKREILAEGRRTFALVDSARAHAWQAAGGMNPVSLARAVKQFWIERDPTPGTLENERLAEHWARVAHARANYAYNRNSAFGTDDRGVMYVKYGSPAQVTSGHLKINSAEARWRGISRDDLFRWDVDPQYEIWRYNSLGERDFTYFMFGNEEGTGPFRFVTGPHEILPRSARSGPGSRLSTGLRAQYYLEFLYYVELARAGGPFGDRLGQLEALWSQMGRAPNEGYLEAMSLAHIDNDMARAAQPRPPSWSAIEETPTSALSAQAVRVIRDGQPRILVLAVSSPRWTPELDEGALPEEIALDDYTPNHTVVVRNQQLHEITRASMLPLDDQGQFSQLMLRHDPRIGHLSVAARHDMASRGLGPRVFPGSRHFVLGAPLSLGLAGFDVSDIIVGIASQPQFRPDNSPVPLLPATHFWKQDLLRVYFEVYRPIGTPESRTTTYDVRIRVLPTTDGQVRDEALPRPPVRDQDLGRVAISVALESAGPAEKHFFDLDLRNEAHGTLRLILEVTDPATSITTTRATVIRLLEI